MSPDKFPSLLIFTCALMLSSCIPTSNQIDRRALVSRHNITFTSPDSVNIPQVGNGEIAFGIDVSGLQSLYGNTMSHWGWHSYPMLEGRSVSDFKMTEVEVHGRRPGYPVDKTGQEDLYRWLRENPHRFNLGRLSFLIDGIPVSSDQLTDITQVLDLWEGVIHSHYNLEGKYVEVITTCHPEYDAIAVQVKSTLIHKKRLKVQIAFPYGHHLISGADWNSGDKHHTSFSVVGNKATFDRTLDQERYQVQLSWFQAAGLFEQEQHFYVLEPEGESNTFSLICNFTQEGRIPDNLNFARVLDDAGNHWANFWNTGGAIDLSESKDPRWRKLERRIVLSQYLLAVNEAGSLPPQESGLLLNSGWYGKFHLEMHWWHGAHYQLWNRWELFDRSLDWYRRKISVAQDIAARQGYAGARWPKMVGPDGRFGPSAIGPWLIWQQVHPIFYAEQNYRIDSSLSTLKKWEEVVFETADFMASYAYYDETSVTYQLGPYLINAAENNQSTMHETINPAFELAYWKYGLQTACNWRERMGLPAQEIWLEVLEKLAPLPIEDSVYVMYENVPDMWTAFNRSHIDVIGPGAFIPNAFVDLNTLNRTVDKVWKEWKMESTWGWDFPWLAMAAARAGQPEKAVDALLMDNIRNTYNRCGINGGGPAGVYFPGNGGLLYAVAMLAGGWDGAPDQHAPGFPEDGSWTVKYECLNSAQ